MITQRVEISCHNKYCIRVFRESNPVAMDLYQRPCEITERSNEHLHVANHTFLSPGIYNYISLIYHMISMGTNVRGFTVNMLSTVKSPLSLIK